MGRQGRPGDEAGPGAARGMAYRALGDEPERSFAIVMVTGDEVVSLVGDITRAADDRAGERRPMSPERTIHGHIVVGRPDGSTLGGHLLEAHVRPTLEVIVTETPARLRRRYDPRTGLALIDLERSDTAPASEGGPTPREA